jgi:ATP-dependent DNA helicase HFM1/MER3
MKLLNRKPHFGHDVIASVLELPHYDLEFKDITVESFGGFKPVEVKFEVHCALQRAAGKVATKKSLGIQGITTILTMTSDLELLDFRRIP